MKASKYWGYLFILPAMIGLILFMWGPVLVSFGLSFYKWNLFTPPEWAGLSNYIKLFGDSLFWTVFKNTIFFALMYSSLLIITAFLVALGLNRRLPFRTGFRLIYFLPVVTSVAAASVVWRWVFNERGGLLNIILGFFGVKGLAWIENPSIALFSMVIMSVWWTIGISMLIFLAGLQDIPKTYYEVAEIDGANSWQKLKYITLPLLTPIIFFVAVVSLINGFKVFGQIYIMTDGGPVNSTNVMLLYMYRKAFINLQFGLGSTVALVLFVIVSALTLIQFKFSGSWVKYR